jgi:hypothetical protein
MYAEKEISRRVVSVLQSFTVIKRRVMLDPKIYSIFFGNLYFEQENTERNQYGKSKKIFKYNHIFLPSH